MARAIDWAQYDALKAQGHSEREMARALAIPRSTLRRELRNREGPLAQVQSPVQPPDTSAESSADIGTVQALRANVNRIDAQLNALTQVVKSIVGQPGQTPVQITALPPFPPGEAVHWNFWILDAIRDKIAAVAAQRGLSPSQLVQEFLWKAPSHGRASTP